MSQLNLSQIREELSKIKDFDSLKTEVKKLITEIEKFDFKKAIPEERMKYIEQKYEEIKKTLQTLQSRAEKELDGVLKKVNKGRADATTLVLDTRAKITSQRKDLEKLLQKNFDYFSKKAKTAVAKEEKQIKKTFKSIKKTAVAQVKKNFKTKTKKKTSTTKTKKSTATKE